VVLGARPGAGKPRSRWRSRSTGRGPVSRRCFSPSKCPRGNHGPGGVGPVGRETLRDPNRAAHGRPDPTASRPRDSTEARTAALIDDGCDLSAARLAAIVRRAVRRKGVRAVVVDYLQLLAPENVRDNRTQQVGIDGAPGEDAGADVRRPRADAVATQSRNGEPPRRRPRLSDLRESGEIEQHADTVLFLHPQVADTDSETPIVEALVRKNRNGPTGETALQYRRTVTRFESRKL
jgi:hypothetical protein